MNIINFESKPINSKIKNEDYFPLCVVFDDTTENKCFLGLYFLDSDLLEFVTDPYGNIKKMQLVICRHYNISKAEYQMNFCKKVGTVSLALDKHTDCDFFDVTVWSNAVTIKLSSNKVHKYYKSGNIVFGLDEENKIIFIAVVEMTSENIEHTICELEEQNQITSPNDLM